MGFAKSQGDYLWKPRVQTEVTIAGTGYEWVESRATALLGLENLAWDPVLSPGMVHAVQEEQYMAIRDGVGLPHVQENRRPCWHLSAGFHKSVSLWALVLEPDEYSGIPYKPELIHKWLREPIRGVFDHVKIRVGNQLHDACAPVVNAGMHMYGVMLQPDLRFETYWMNYGITPDGKHRGSLHGLRTKLFGELSSMLAEIQWHLGEFLHQQKGLETYLDGKTVAIRGFTPEALEYFSPMSRKIRKLAGDDPRLREQVAMWLHTEEARKNPQYPKDFKEHEALRERWAWVLDHKFQVNHDSFTKYHEAARAIQRASRPRMTADERREAIKRYVGDSIRHHEQNFGTWRADQVVAKAIYAVIADQQYRIHPGEIRREAEYQLLNCSQFIQRGDRVVYATPASMARREKCQEWLTRIREEPQAEHTTGPKAEQKAGTKAQEQPKAEQQTGPKTEQKAGEKAQEQPKAEQQASAKTQEQPKAEQQADLKPAEVTPDTFLAQLRDYFNGTGRAVRGMTTEKISRAMREALRKEDQIVVIRADEVQETLDNLRSRRGRFMTGWKAFLTAVFRERGNPHERAHKVEAVYRELRDKMRFKKRIMIVVEQSDCVPNWAIEKLERLATRDKASVVKSPTPDETAQQLAKIYNRTITKDPYRYRLERDRRWN